MKDLKFTPGPWFLINDPDTLFFPLIGFSPTAKRTDYHTILINSSHDDEYDTIVANAQLISKAPEMYEALKQAKEALEKADNAEDIDDIIHYIGQALGTINRLEI